MISPSTSEKEVFVFTVDFDDAPRQPISAAVAIIVAILKFFICFSPMSYNLYSFLLALTSSYFKGPNMNYTKSLLLFFVSLLFISCATVSCGEVNTRPNTLDISHTRELPRKSFLKINKNINFKICMNEKKPDDCVRQRMRSTGSGFIIGNVPEGAFIMTAAHVCDVSDLVTQFSTDPKITFLGEVTTVEDVRGHTFNAVVLEMDKEADLCIAFVHGLQSPPVQIAYNGPTAGDQAHNLAAPVGFMSKGLIPTLHGNYNGRYGRYASYSIPAVGGSSGSPIFDTSGKVIGMIHSVHTRFQFLTFSPTHEEIYKLASKYTRL
jgi:S1-C subfamily serine protease